MSLPMPISEYEDYKSYLEAQKRKVQGWIEEEIHTAFGVSHCIKCGDEVLGDEDSLCWRCA